MAIESAVVTLVVGERKYGDEWWACYVNGKMIQQGPVLRVSDVLDFLVGKHLKKLEHFEVNPGNFDERGYLPSLLKDVVLR